MGCENVRDYDKIFIIVEASYEYVEVHHTILLCSFEVFQNKGVFFNWHCKMKSGVNKDRTFF